MAIDRHHADRSAITSRDSAALEAPGRFNVVTFAQALEPREHRPNRLPLWIVRARQTECEYARFARSNSLLRVLSGPT